MSVALEGNGIIGYRSVLVSTEPEENKENPEAEEPKSDKPAAKSGGIMKYAVIGGGAFLLVVLIAVGSVFLLKEDPPEVTDSSEILEETHAAGYSIRNIIADKLLFERPGKAVCSYQYAELTVIDTVANPDVPYSTHDPLRLSPFIGWKTYFDSVTIAYSAPQFLGLPPAVVFD